MVGAPGNSLARGTALAPSYWGYRRGHLSTPAAAPIRAGPSPPLRSCDPATDRAGRTRGWWGKGRTPFQFSPSRMPCDAVVHSEGHSLGATWPSSLNMASRYPKGTGYSAEPKGQVPCVYMRASSRPSGCAWDMKKCPDALNEN